MRGKWGGMGVVGLDTWGRGRRRGRGGERREVGEGWRSRITHLRILCIFLEHSRDRDPSGTAYREW